AMHWFREWFGIQRLGKAADGRGYVSTLAPLLVLFHSCEIEKGNPQMVLGIEVAERNRKQTVALDETISEQGRAEFEPMVHHIERQGRNIELLANAGNMDFCWSGLAASHQRSAPDDDRQANLALRQLLGDIQRS